MSGHAATRADFDFHSGRVLKTRLQEGQFVMATLLDATSDVRLDENQISMMNQIIESGIEPREAKLRVMCIAKPPDHFQVIPTGYKPYPRMIYREDGSTKVVHSKAEHDKASDAGWSDTPLEVHVSRASAPKAEPASFEVTPSIQIAAEKRKSRAATKS